MKTDAKWHHSPLSRDVQIPQLCALAKQAKKAAQKRGDPDAELSDDEWRKKGQNEATNTPNFSLKTATQGHYLPLRGYWFVILGNLQGAFYDYLNAGDQAERCRQLKWRLAGEVSRLADGIATEKSRQTPPIHLDHAQAAAEAWHYAEWLAKQPLFAAKGLSNLDADALKRLCDTVYNRASAKHLPGSTHTRNKSQRAANRLKKATASPSQDTLEPRSSVHQAPRLPVSRP